MRVVDMEGSDMAKRATIYLSSDTLAHLGECDNLSRRVAEMARICAKYGLKETEIILSRYREIIDSVSFDFTEDEWRALRETLGKYGKNLTVQQVRTLLLNTNYNLGTKYASLPLAAQYAVHETLFAASEGKDV